jgi:hypothetical protein
VGAFVFDNFAGSRPSPAVRKPEECGFLMENTKDYAKIGLSFCGIWLYNENAKLWKPVRLQKIYWEELNLCLHPSSI